MPTVKRERWTSEVRLIWTLFAVIGTLLCIMGSFLWGRVERNSEDIRSLTEFVQRSDEVHKEVLRRLERIERKVEDK